MKLTASQRRFSSVLEGGFDDFRNEENFKKRAEFQFMVHEDYSGCALSWFPPRKPYKSLCALRLTPEEFFSKYWSAHETLFSVAIREGISLNSRIWAWNVYDKTIEDMLVYLEELKKKRRDSKRAYRKRKKRNELRDKLLSRIKMNDRHRDVMSLTTNINNIKIERFLSHVG